MTVNSLRELAHHWGHHVEVALYGRNDGTSNLGGASIECTTCGTVLFNFEEFLTASQRADIQEWLIEAHMADIQGDETFMRDVVTVYVYDLSDNDLLENLPDELYETFGLEEDDDH